MIHRVTCSCHDFNLGIFHSEADVRVRAFALHAVRYGAWPVPGPVVRSEGLPGEITYYLHAAGASRPAMLVRVTDE